MKLLNNKFLPFILSGILVVIFFWQFFFKGLLPIPADTIIGLYHPYRDLYAKDYPRGVPFKNALITDPVRQQYPWKKLVIEQEKKGQLPIWNPFEMAGKPLLANFQSGAFYPLNLLFFIFPFNFAWSLYIVSQPFLAIIFIYFFLRNLKVSKISSLFGAFTFAFSGFSIAWLEWGNIIHTALWLPLILLSVDKIIQGSKLKIKGSRFKWFFFFILALCSSLFAGHLQIFFYVLIVSIAYIFFRWTEQKDWQSINKLIICFLLFVIFTSFQWIPTFKFIYESARNIDLTPLSEGWFLPWQHLIQFIAPDFFGNPTTLNYWGVWNYAEFVGYVGIFPLILAFFALSKKDRNILFFGLVFFVSLALALPTFLSKLPYLLEIPFVSTAQPTRLIFLADFSLSILAALGLDFFLKSRKGIIYPVILVGAIIFLLWFMVINSNDPNFLVAKRNIVLPTIVFITSLILILLPRIKNFRSYIPYVIFALVIFDLFRFGWKFIPFTKEEYLFPPTKVLDYIQKQNGLYRVMTVDSRIFPPNLASVYRIESVDGYDPLYLQGYGEFIAALERGEPNISPPFGFNRIITPHRIDSKITNLLGVRFILSLVDLESPSSEMSLTKILEEGQTKLYENKNYSPRAFFVTRTVSAQDKEDAIKKVFKENMSNVAVVESFRDSDWSRGTVEVKEYSENSIQLLVKNKGKGFLVLANSFYPAWHAKIDGKDSKIFNTNHNFMGLEVPEGEHSIVFNISLF